MLACRRTSKPKRSRDPEPGLTLLYRGLRSRPKPRPSLKPHSLAETRRQLQRLQQMQLRLALATSVKAEPAAPQMALAKHGTHLSQQ